MWTDNIVWCVTCCCNREHALPQERQKKITYRHLPLNAVVWQWPYCTISWVWIEAGSIYTDSLEIKGFDSLFTQFTTNGLELCVFKSSHFQLTYSKWNVIWTACLVWHWHNGVVLCCHMLRTHRGFNWPLAVSTVGRFEIIFPANHFAGPKHTASQP